MKQVKTILSLVLVSMFLIACAEEKNTASVRSGNRGQRNNTNGNQDYKSAAWSGVIYGSPQNLFQEATEDFVSSFMPSNELGDVSGQFNQATGVRFSTKINSQGFNRTNFNGITFQSGALELMIFDSVAEAGQADAIVISTLKLTGTQNFGNSIKLIFADTWSEVTLTGQLSGNYFVGSIGFNNKNNVNGNYSPAKWNTWGGIQIPACDLIRCN